MVSPSDPVAPDETPRETVGSVWTSDGSAASTPTVTLRYWAASRAAAGTTQEQVSARTLAEALAAAVARHTVDGRFAQVVAISSLLLGEQPVGNRDASTVTLQDGDVIDVLPPFAGG
ncbi:MAG: MoaD/ThiS family protein [Nocardioidaceae bacterium]